MEDIDPSICRSCATMRREDDRVECRRRHYRVLNGLGGIGVIRFPEAEEAKIVRCRDYKPRTRVGLLSF